MARHSFISFHIPATKDTKFSTMAFLREDLFGTEFIFSELQVLKKQTSIYHSRHSEVTSVHLLGEPIHLPAGIAEDHSLSDGKSLVQVAQSIQLPLL